MLEQHYTIAQMGEKWNLSYDFVLEHIRDELGVVRAGMHGSRKRRVAARV